MSTAYRRAASTLAPALAPSGFISSSSPQHPIVAGNTLCLCVFPQTSSDAARDFILISPGFEFLMLSTYNVCLAELAQADVF